MVLDTLQNLLNQTGFATLDWGNYVMILVALVFMYLQLPRDLNLCYLFQFLLVCCW